MVARREKVLVDLRRAPIPAVPLLAGNLTGDLVDPGRGTVRVELLANPPPAATGQHRGYQQEE